MKLFLTTIFHIPILLFSQNSNMGINTDSPKALLDISAKSVSNPADNDGMLFPIIKNFSNINPTINHDGLLVHLDNTLTPNLGISGLYFWDNNNNKWQYIFQNKTLKNNLFKVVYSANPAFPTISGASSDIWFKSNFNVIDTPYSDFKITSNGDILIGNTGNYYLIFTGGATREASSANATSCEIGIFKNLESEPLLMSKFTIAAPDNFYRSTNVTISGILSLTKGDILSVKTRRILGSSTTTNSLYPSTNYSLILSNLN